MVRFLLKKLAEAAFLLFLSFTLLFGLLRVLGDPAQMLLGQRSDQASLEAIRKSLHLDKPLWQQYLYAWADFLPYGEGGWRLPTLGISYQYGRPVGELYAERFPATALLSLVALGIAAFMGIGAGLWHAYRPQPLLHMFSLVGLSLPGYVVGVLLIGVGAFALGVLPPSGYVWIYDPVAEKVVFSPSHLFLPSVALALRPAAYLFQLTAAQARQILGADYIRAAYARGKAPLPVLLSDVLRNLLPALSVSLSQWLASLFTGALFLEELFDWPGVGKLLFTALSTSDFPLLMGTAQLSAALFIFLHTAGEVLAWRSDPRLRKS
uniref:Peptide/nickel transport system permease protein n=1 Tax=uncultured Bacteroidota bacterium TaxID=152509 RepID=H5SIH0_9BACT|nr:peptide/nickel transport system permease protein [uncultured Bacteroidetes bacterium]